MTTMVVEENQYWVQDKIRNVIAVSDQDLGLPLETYVTSLDLDENLFTTF